MTAWTKEENEMKEPKIFKYSWLGLKSVYDTRTNVAYVWRTLESYKSMEDAVKLCNQRV